MLLFVVGPSCIGQTEREGFGTVVAAFDFPLLPVAGKVGFRKVSDHLYNLQFGCCCDLQAIVIGKFHDVLTMSHKLTDGKLVVHETFICDPSVKRYVEEPDGQEKLPLSEPYRGSGDR